MQRAISEYHISGITTNIALFSRIMADPMFREGKLHTGYLDDELKNLQSVSGSSEELQVALLASALQAQQELSSESNLNNHDGVSAWRLSRRRNLQR
jgi:acetyl/propionyl-CoA carboxylase alpha subunit